MFHVIGGEFLTKKCEERSDLEGLKAKKTACVRAVFLKLISGRDHLASIFFSLTSCAITAVPFLAMVFSALAVSFTVTNLLSS